MISLHGSNCSRAIQQLLNTEVETILNNHRILICGPETFTENENFLKFLRKLSKIDRIERFVIEETHTILQWGHSFRPCYLKIEESLHENEIRSKRIPVSCFTATITSMKMEMTMDLLRMNNVQKFIGTDYTIMTKLPIQLDCTFDRLNFILYTGNLGRNNLEINVVQYSLQFQEYFKDEDAQIKRLTKGMLDLEYVSTIVKANKLKRCAMMHIVNEVLSKYEKQCGIIYCISCKDCDKLFEFLSACGVSVTKYYAESMDKNIRESRQDKWFEGGFNVMVATCAFGLGIDKSNVRFVIQCGMTEDLTSYAQQIGRAGRDGQTSCCTMYYNFSDFKR